MAEAPEAADVAVVGAGLRGLAAALRLRRERPGARVLVVDAAPQPGGSVRTVRTNGFVCETGPFAFLAEEIEPVCALLDAPPAPIACLETARAGHLVDGRTLVPVAVEPLPWSFASGNEELVQACRRALGGVLRLGRAVTSIAGARSFVLELGGEVPARVAASELVLALPDAAAAALAGAFDPALAAVAARVAVAPGAMVFFGGSRADAPELRGYGFVPAPGLAAATAEVICCSEVFAQRALPGRFLVRSELAGPAAAAVADEAVLAAAEHDLRAWTGTRAPFALRKVHRFVRPVADGAAAECRVRLRELPARVPGLALA